jgi:hypothetical protein
VEFVVVDAETMQTTEKKKNFKQTRSIHDDVETRRAQGTRTTIIGGVPTTIRGVPKKIMGIHGDSRPDPWVITDADRRPLTTTHNEPMDEAREPAREHHARPEVPVGVVSFGRTSAGAITQAVQHEEQSPPEREQVVAPSGRQTNETREPVREPLAHSAASIRDNPSDLTLGVSASMGNLTTNKPKESRPHLN